MAKEVHDPQGCLKFWKRAAIAVMWLVGPILMGILAATVSGEHGSIVFVVIGLYVGVPGAISYLLLPLFSRFRRLGGLGRFVSYTVAATLPTVACASYVVMGDSRSTASLFFFMSGIAAGFACICAMLVAQVASLWVAQPRTQRFR